MSHIKKDTSDLLYKYNSSVHETKSASTAILSHPVLKAKPNA
jgi:hypothetical protein